MGENNHENSKIANWFNGLREEFHKIVWLDRITLGKQTLAVIIVSVILGIIIAVLDFGIQHGIDFLVTL